MGTLAQWPRDASSNYSYVVNRTDAQINYIERTDGNGIVQRQTWTYTGDYVTAASLWVTQ